jgi:hypothetical protein
VAMPTTTTEVAFTTDPGATPTWTDVSAYQREFVVHRGRADDQSPFGPGQLELTLTNEDRRFDPQYASSPYYPNVVPMRRIRIRATYNAVTYDIFNGYVTDWRQTYSPPQSAECVVEATDAFKVLGNIELPASVYYVEVGADGPDYWWRLDEEAGSETVLDTHGVALEAFGAPAMGAAGLVQHDPGGAYSAADATSGFTATGEFVPPAQVTLSLEAIVKTTTAVEATIAAVGDPGNGGHIRLYVSSGGAAVFEVGKTVAGNRQSVLVGSGADVNDGEPHHVVGVIDDQAFSHLWVYVDGVGTDGGEIGYAIPWGTNQDFTIGNSGRGFVNDRTQGIVGTIDEVALYLTELDDATIEAHSAARATPWNGDLSGVRVGRVLDAAGWPAADRNVDTGQAVLQSADLAGTALSILQKIEQTEQGALFVTGAGLVRFIGRDSLLSAPYTTSQGTFGDSGVELEYGDLSYTYDDSLIFNEIHVSRSGGTVVVVGDTPSQTRYLRRTRTYDGLLHQDDSTSLDLANWALAHYKDPTLRVTGMRLEPSAGNETTHFPHALGRELLDRVTVLRRPQNLGAAISQEVMIQGITHTVTAVEWVTSWDLSPAETQVYWILGVAGFSELGETTRLGF